MSPDTPRTAHGVAFSSPEAPLTAVTALWWPYFDVAAMKEVFGTR
jgi:hypothetical protein